MLGLANRAKFDSFLLFLKLLLSNHPKTIIEPSSMTQDSTLDTQQGAQCTICNFRFAPFWGKEKLSSIIASFLAGNGSYDGSINYYQKKKS